MSNAAAADAAPPKKGNKKLIIIIAAVAVLVLGAGGAAVVLLKKKPADAEAEAEEDGGAHKPAKSAAKHDPKNAPTFVPLEPFTVNLADREAERFVQVGITLEIADSHVADSIKAFMPAIRNNILLALADRTAAELMDREGKRKLADRIRKETSKALGAEVEEERAATDDEADTKPAKKGKKKKAAEPDLPISAVHFSNFIIQ